MRLLLASLLAISALGCGRDGPLDSVDTSEPLTTVTTTASGLTGRWALGANVIHGLPGPDDTLENAGSPYAVLTLQADGSFDLMFGAGCIIEGISGTWVTTPAGTFLSMEPDQWQTWTDGVSAHPKPTSLNAALDGDELLVTGVDELGQPIAQRWRRY